MKGIIKKSVAILLLMVFICSNSFSVIAADAKDVLLPYRDKLAEFNEKMGTQYKIPTESELQVVNNTLEELKAFYTNMSIEEFENYIMELHIQNISSEKELHQQLVNEENGIMPLAKDSFQTYFYSTHNFFWLEAKTVTVNDVVYYNSFVDAGTGYSGVKDYPYYDIINTSYSVSDNSRKIYVTYKYSKYLSQNLMDAVLYSSKITFTAGK